MGIKGEMEYWSDGEQDGRPNPRTRKTPILHYSFIPRSFQREKLLDSEKF